MHRGSWSVQEVACIGVINVTCEEEMTYFQCEFSSPYLETPVMAASTPI